MKGLELARQYYETYGRPMLSEQFPDVADRIAVGLVGEGSECLGFDDAVSTDHDFEPGFCLFITKEDERQFGFRLERAYAKLPSAFCGFRRERVSPVGGSRHGVMVIDDFYRKLLGAPCAPDTAERWLYTPSSALACASNGEVFRDDLGAFSAVRRQLLLGYPEEVMRKKLAAHTVFMAQAGQYNYERCMRHGEHGAAQLAMVEFVRHAVSAIYLLNGAYEPFYKWVYRGMDALSVLSELKNPLIALTELGNEPLEFESKRETVEEIAAMFAAEFRRRHFSKVSENHLEQHAYAIQETIRDPNLRGMHIMEGI